MDFVRNAWYFAAWRHELDDGPLYRKICGDEIAFFRDRQGEVQALGAICPHRGANLGKGRVVEGTLQCPYHGWQFDKRGQCVRVPSQTPDMKIPPGARVPSYAVRERQGVVWIWPGRDTAPFEDTPLYKAFDDESSLIRHGPELLDSEFVNVVENAFDDSHVHFLHRTSIGVDTPILPRQIVERNEDGRGLTMRWDQDSPWGQELFTATDNPSSPFARLLIRLYGETDFDKRYAQFRMGGVIKFDLPTTKGYQQRIIGAATPMDEKRTWFATALNHPLSRSRLPRPLVRWFGRTINAEDQIGTVGLLRPASRHESPISVQADRGGLAFRRLYEDLLKEEIASSAAPRDRASPGSSRRLASR